jgi:two-component system phosphate regulon sensor histidine kinase PhoR
MLRSPFFWRLYASFLLVTLLSGALIGLVVGDRLLDRARLETEGMLRSSAILLSEAFRPAMREPVDPSVAERVRRLGKELDLRITLVAADGKVLADSDGDPERMDNHADRPEIIETEGRGVGHATRFSKSLHTTITYVAIPVRDDADKLVGYVRTAIPTSVLDARRATVRRDVAAGTGFSAIVVLGLGFILTHRLTRSVRSITRAAEAMAEGDYDERVPVTGRGELGKLGDVLNRLADSSRERMETITTDRNKLLAILGGMVEGVVAVDRQERILHLNAAAGRILNVDPEACLGKRVWEVTRVREVSEILARTLGGETEARREMQRVSHPRDRVVEMAASPLRDGDGDLVGAVVVLHDVSELRQLEVIRRDFVANVSHELKTPITAIRGLVETLLDDPGMDAATRARFLEKVREQGLRMSSLVFDLLSLARLETEPGVLSRVPLDLRDPVGAAARALLPTGRERGIEVVLSLPEDRVPVLGDQNALGEVTTNLLDNALKYTPRGGRIRVRLHVQGSDAVLEVEDTGIGIDPVHQERIFERFYRVDKARSRDLGGTGLGLSIVKHICRVHEGDISVESVPGRGTTFRVRLPLASPEPE